MANTQHWLDRGRASLIQNYGRSPVVMVRGQGSHVYDADGKEYLDLFAGFGGCVLGHCHPDLVAAATEQAGKLWHVGNALYTTPQIEFAERLQAHAFDGRAFFCHSGLEANEAAVKLARLRGMADGGKRWKTLTLNKSFHGRSLAMIAATGNPATKDGFGPAVPGFVNVDGHDLDALKAAIDDETCAILMEPIQGEGGINMYPAGHPAAIRKLCDEHGLTLIFDEVWTGCGRTGEWFAHQHDDVLPDVMTLGKAVGGGLPVGVMYARPGLAAMLTPGKHGCTLGGNPICMAVARTIFDVIARDGLLAHVQDLHRHATAKLEARADLRKNVKAIRGRGAFLGIELHREPVDFAAQSLAAGLVLNVTAKNVIRLAPPVDIPLPLWDQGLDRTFDLIASL